MEAKNSTRLLVLDIDNTVFDWVTYYTHSFRAMLDKVSDVTKIDRATLAAEAKVIFQAHGSIEYPFVIQEMPSVNAYYGTQIDRMLQECVEPARLVFKMIALSMLKPYDGVEKTLQGLRRDFPTMPIVALTDAPRYVAMWKLNKLGLLEYFAAVYGLADPRIPTCATLGRVKVDPQILLKHLQQSNFGYLGKIRILPEDYEKPGTRGLKTVLMDYEMDESAADRRAVLWVGDNLRKDVGLGNKLGVRTAWAEYGTKVSADLLAQLGEFSPPHNVSKNVYLAAGAAESPVPEITLKNFSEIERYLYG